MSGVNIIYSNGNGKGGKMYAFVRPDMKCFNRSRRVQPSRVAEEVKKWFTPMNYYIVDGETIGSNSEENALKEYWRVCDKEKIGKHFQVTSKIK